MAKTNKAKTAAETAQNKLGTQDTQEGGGVSEAAETAQDELDAQDVTQDTQTDGDDSAAAETAQDASVTREILGPEDPAELAGCQDTEDEGVLDVPLEYAVAGCEYLNLRERPGLDAPVIVPLPKGVGVSNLDEIVIRPDGEWWKVITGKLAGWVMGAYLEPVWS